jgi:hypothetical protein
MNRLLLVVFSFCFFIHGLSAENSQRPTYCDKAYEKVLLQRVAATLPELTTFPFLQYPNDNHQNIVNHYPSGKVLLFG